MLLISIDATITIAFGLASAATALIAHHVEAGYNCEKTPFKKSWVSELNPATEADFLKSRH
jgi:hypothetical protein